MPVDRDTEGLKSSNIDRLIHEPARYNIMALLYVVEMADFLFVQNQTHLTPGNLSTHISKLEQAGYLKIRKKFVGRKPRTHISLTSAGRKAFEDYRERMRELFTKPPVAPKYGNAE